MRSHLSSQLSLLLAVLLMPLAAFAQTGFSVASATALPATAAAGQTIKFTASLKSGAAANNMVVDFELYSPSGARVGQTYYQGQNFLQQQSKAYSWSYTIPAGGTAGHYALMIGVFTGGWSSDVYWNASAASFTVAPVVNGACGSANGATLTSAPTTNLCTSGQASALTGSGPWQWSCAGSNGGSTASCKAAVPSSSPGSGGSVGQSPSGLPSTFFIGLGANPNQLQSWVPSSGVPWALCSQYISSGVLPSQSWVTAWGTNFAYNYAVSARAAHCIPDYDYYQIVPTIGAEGASAESTALNNASIMANYYKDFTALMKQLHQYGSAAVVHVEPDMWGYLESLGRSPAQLTASVASSGNADLAAYPNTVAGFGQALIHLRDLYAPNVIMAAHVSEWLWSVSTDPSLNVAQIAKNDAAFMTATGNWDVFFTDVSAFDAGYYQFALGDSSRWWDKTNQKYPNFNRFNTWAAAFTAAAQKRLVIWQVPVGNTVMRTCNNTNFHYQDDRDEYWLSNYPNNPGVSELAQAGVIGLVFAAGNSGTTDNFDSAGDGITNPTPINGNNQVSTYPDDDGGLLRLNVGNYYRSGAAPLR
jgi:hypothetical protein